MNINKDKEYITPVCNIIQISVINSILETSSGFEGPVDDGELNWE